MLPLQNVTDARYVYRCLDAALRQAKTVHSTFTSAEQPTKTLLSRCQGLAKSIHKKLVRCSGVLGRNEALEKAVEDTSLLILSIHSNLTFPPRFSSNQATTLTPLRIRSSTVKKSIAGLLKEAGEYLASKKQRKEASYSAPDESDSMIETFLTKAKGKGWKIHEPKKNDKFDVEDPFGEGCRLLEQVMASYQQLLEDDVEVGIIPCPILLMEAYKIPESVFMEMECGNSIPLHRVFGTYVVLQDVKLMGIHHDLMSTVVGSNGEIQIDASRFRYLLPYLRLNVPGAAEVLSTSVPSGPPRFARFHYYTPLLPISIVGASNFNLGNWHFLTRKREQRRANTEK